MSIRMATLAFAALAIASPALAQEHGSADEATALVKKAVAHYKAVGMEKACATFADPAGGFQAKDLYIFVQDMKGLMVCHAKNAGLNTKDLSNLKDTEGKMFVAEMIKLSNEKGSGWVDYKWVNAATKKIEPKSSYIVRDGEYFIGAGIYKP